MKKQREQILLEPEQKKQLQAESDRTGASKAEIVRRALDNYLNDSWDRQMKRDREAGRLDDILDRAKRQYEEEEYSEI